ncbi:MAG: MerR family DNA-binding transcriptional regulator [Candidatus Yanofskybacteria bacterium]|nr:MerR family DNA-binding transcriptional regulator [Candidatus Yanofskybacteria bacterium]MBI2676830.1 MerR family DNA-binding transcriptional regulator [Candidatus Yanofskybacteria bacterium]
MPKQYLTVNEVAKIIGVSPLTVRNWDQKGRLVAYRNPLNNYRLYKVSDVENLLKEIEGSQGKTFSPPPKLEPEKPKFRKLEIEIE